MSQTPPDPTRDDGAFIGRGFAWPLRTDRHGNIAMSSGVESLDDAVRLVLMTAPGERLMRPQFGCRIWELLFEPVTDNLLGLINQAVRQALAQWEPRIEVEDVVSRPAANDPSRLAQTPTQDDDRNYLLRVTPGQWSTEPLASERHLLPPAKQVPAKQDDPRNSSRVDIAITYRVRATNDRRNLVYPFYVIPHDAE